MIKKVFHNRNTDIRKLTRILPNRKCFDHHFHKLSQEAMMRSPRSHLLHMAWKEECHTEISFVYSHQSWRTVTLLP